MTYSSDDRPAGTTVAAAEILVTPGMAKAGADLLRRTALGESLEDVATDLYYTMQAAYVSALGRVR